MAMQLEKVVPFGRSLAEYRLMFALSEDDLDRRILGVGDGPASFNAEMRTSQKTVVSVDPLYIFAGRDIERQFYAVVDGIIAQVEASAADWVWDWHRSPSHLRESREAALRRFLADYEAGKQEGRYVLGELPHLNFGPRRFDLALCSHLLFLYSDHFTYEFHRDAILEMLRVAGEARIFPLLTLDARLSPYLDRIIRELEGRGFRVDIERVDYEFQRGGNQMMRVTQE